MGGPGPDGTATGGDGIGSWWPRQQRNLSTARMGQERYCKSKPQDGAISAMLIRFANRLEKSSEQRGSWPLGRITSPIFEVKKEIPVYILLLLAAGCSTSSPPPDPPPDPPAIPLVNASSPLTIPTYDGSGQVTEPNVIFFESSWHGFKYWMVFTPYPNGNASKENPSIVVSEDGFSWQVPLGLVNPLDLPLASDRHLADASIFYDQNSDRIWVYYIRYRDVIQVQNIQVLRLVSADGNHWQNEGVLFTVPIHEILSPSVAKIGDTYSMWSVKASSAGCRTSGTAVEYRVSSDGAKWSQPQPTTLRYPDM
jgi:hypothetical protein